jgi:hypothetical protein
MQNARNELATIGVVIIMKRWKKRVAEKQKTASGGEPNAVSC